MTPLSVAAQSTLVVGTQLNGGNAATLAGRWESNFNPMVGVEWSLSYTRTDAVHRMLFSPSVIVNIIPRQPYLPYALVGYGVAVSFPRAADLDPFADLLVGRTIHYGAGLKYYFKDTIGIRGEIRRINLDPDLFRGRDEVDLPVSNITELTVGFIFGFDF